MRIKEQETHLTLQEHDDDDVCNEVLRGDNNWFCLAEDVFQWPAVVKVVTKLQVTRQWKESCPAEEPRVVLSRCPSVWVVN